MKGRVGLLGFRTAYNLPT